MTTAVPSRTVLRDTRPSVDGLTEEQASHSFGGSADIVVDTCLHSVEGVEDISELPKGRATHISSCDRGRAINKHRREVLDIAIRGNLFP